MDSLREFLACRDCKPHDPSGWAWHLDELGPPCSCLTCHGSGRLQMPCETCGGKWAHVCSGCKGYGTRPATEADVLALLGEALRELGQLYQQYPRKSTYTVLASPLALMGGSE